MVWYLLVKGLVVLEVLPQGLEEQSELDELEESVSQVLLSAAARGLLGVVERPVNGRLRVEQVVHVQNVTDPLLSLEKECP